MTSLIPIDHVPDGYRKNSFGHLVPIDQIEEIDLTRDALVLEIAQYAEEMNGQLAAFKKKSFEDITAFIQLSADRYGVTLGGKKGNVTMYSFDGEYKIQRNIQERLDFDEKLLAAKELMYECAANWTEHADGNIKVLIDWVFETNKDGQISTARVLSLRSRKIVDEKWQRAMEIIADSLRVVDSKSYIRMYKRVGSTDQYVPISLDLASV